MDPTHPIILEALRRTKKTCITLFFFLLLFGGGLALASGWSTENQAVTITCTVFGVVMALCSLAIGRQAILYWDPMTSPVMAILRDKPGEIVWIHVVQMNTQSGGITVQKTYSVRVWTDKKPYNLNVKAEQKDELLSVLSAIAPQATCGYSKALKRQYKTDPGSLVRRRLSQEEVRLPPAIPVDIDDTTVALGSAAPGPYLRIDGSEAYGRAATVTLLADGSEQEIGVGGVLRLGNRAWVATAFEADGSLVLQPADALETPPPTPESANPIIYPDAEMANLWVQWHLPFATWRVDLRDAGRRNPEELRQFASAILRAGEESGAMRIVQFPQHSYRREDDGSLLPHLEQRWKALGGPDLFSDTQGMIVESQVAWLDGTGRLFDTPVKHLELILEMDEPVEGALDGFREPHPPVAISGPSWSVIQRASQGLPTGPLELEITLYSDIWFPWIAGMGHPLADHVRKFDNRVLAEKHTPRLNAFLREVHRAAVTIGSRLQLDRDECRVRPEYVSDQGVELNVPAPTQQMTEAERNAPWS